MKQTYAGDLVRGPAATVESKASLQTVAQKLGDLGIGILVVLDEDTVVGVVSERDLVWAIARGADLEDVWAADVMTPDVVTVSPQTGLDEIATTMMQDDLRHVLVGGPGTPAIVSMRDVVEYLVEP